MFGQAIEVLSLVAVVCVLSWYIFRALFSEQLQLQLFLHRRDQVTVHFRTFTHDKTDDQIVEMAKHTNVSALQCNGLISLITENPNYANLWKLKERILDRQLNIDECLITYYLADEFPNLVLSSYLDHGGRYKRWAAGVQRWISTNSGACSFPVHTELTRFIKNWDEDDLGDDESMYPYRLKNALQFLGTKLIVERRNRLP